MAGLLLGATIAWNRVQIISLKDKIHKLFGEYVDSTVRDKILSKNALSERKKATILFSDIRGFTTLSETYTPEEITELLNQYFSVWDKQVKIYRGIIDKFIGDAVMIIFEKEQDAVLCAESVLHHMPQLHKELQVNKLPAITIGIGIHTGTVIAGTIGSASRKNYTVIGDTVNIASRLEGLCKKYHQELIISETTYAKLTAKKTFSRLTKVILRGKKKSITIYGLKKKE